MAWFWSILKKALSGFFSGVAAPKAGAKSFSA
jgi:hypothetical protein